MAEDHGRREETGNSVEESFGVEELDRIRGEMTIELEGRRAQ